MPLNHLIRLFPVCSNFSPETRPREKNPVLKCTLQQLPLAFYRRQILKELSMYVENHSYRFYKVMLKSFKSILRISCWYLFLLILQPTSSREGKKALSNQMPLNEVSKEEKLYTKLSYFNDKNCSNCVSGHRLYFLLLLINLYSLLKFKLSSFPFISTHTTGICI